MEALEPALPSKCFNPFSNFYFNTALAQCHHSLGHMNTESEKLSMVAFHPMCSQPGFLHQTFTAPTYK